jgi:DNA-binding Xre family transcriptional regulator
MTANLDYRWHLREMMAQAGMHSTSAMGPLLADRGIRLSSSQVYRLVTEKPERLNLKVLMALLDVLNCSIEDLIEPSANSNAATHPQRKAAGGDSSEVGVGAFRPKRARINPPRP